MFERLLEAAPALGARLTTQYRMHATICDWSSREFYDGDLVAADTVAAHTLAQLDHVAATDETEASLFFVDTAGCDCEEDADEAPPPPKGGGAAAAADATAASKSNAAEARLAAAHVRALLAAGVRPAEIGVITPYNAQVEALRAELEPERRAATGGGGDATGGFSALEVGTVDGFQGREKEAIVISMVRSNGRREVGFLSEDRRMNVAVTRGRRHVALIGDSATAAAHPFLSRLVDHFSEHGEVRSAAMYGEAESGGGGGGGGRWRWRRWPARERRRRRSARRRARGAASAPGSRCATSCAPSRRRPTRCSSRCTQRFCG